MVLLLGVFWDSRTEFQLYGEETKSHQDWIGFSVAGNVEEKKINGQKDKKQHQIKANQRGKTTVYRVQLARQLKTPPKRKGWLPLHTVLAPREIEIQHGILPQFFGPSRFAINIGQGGSPCLLLATSSFPTWSPKPSRRPSPTTPSSTPVQTPSSSGTEVPLRHFPIS